MAEVVYDWSHKPFNYKPSNEQLEDWKAQAKSLSNSDLLDQYSNLCGGDDYDGCHSKEGLEVYNIVTNELYERLMTIGFLTKDTDGGTESS